MSCTRMLTSWDRGSQTHLPPTTPTSSTSLQRIRCQSHVAQTDCLSCVSIHSSSVGNSLSIARISTYDSLRQWLSKCVNWTKGLLGRCLRHSFGMPSIPQAFFNFNVSINFFKSQGLIFSGGSVSSASSVFHGFLHTKHVV
jgi:hypothetical protein